ncbi:putative spo7-like protein [Phaeoacremonium minimum UCRPA7]|uniref:Putative spo7-like protein n=1 Tax=Phaeoacremonium minimum (strain UCR-PA7) TaxID=1286976 RepID=R8BX19_PHAM7|nr:putative spo7-like protein [Phaeoacremonium minimum UCRPA7]EOO03903.1 putative spo7-like protein [Phaeoacremonium minimum UCRPA7]
MADDVDSIVKGTAAPPTENLAKEVGGTSGVTPSSGAKADPLSHIPSSPSMIYLNLLILEASLRAQYLELRARRRHHTFFLTLLSLWVVGFGYALFLAPREDGRGVGGSVYWVVEVTEKVCFMGGIITAILVWGTGIWERGVRWPRRWFGISNRGLRGFNCKLVIIKRPWYVETLATIVFFLTYGLFSNTAGSSYRYVEPAILREVDKELKLSSHGHQPLPIVSEDEERGGHEEDLAPGGDHVKLLLLAKPFSPTFRENWELYRTEYWERENERRALIRAKIQERDRRLQKETGGWFWWLPWRKATVVVVDKPHPVVEKPHGHHPRHSLVEKEHRRSRSNSVRRGSISTTGSRSPTPGLEVDEAGVLTRKASTSSNASDKRKKKLVPGVKPKRPGVDSRSVTPEFPSPLAKESSFSSVGSSASALEGGRRAQSPSA